MFLVGFSRVLWAGTRWFLRSGPAFFEICIVKRIQIHMRMLVCMCFHIVQIMGMLVCIYFHIVFYNVFILGGGWCANGSHKVVAQGRAHKSAQGGQGIPGTRWPRNSRTRRHKVRTRYFITLTTSIELRRAAIYTYPDVILHL